VGLSPNVGRVLELGGEGLAGVLGPSPCNDRVLVNGR
jgi:hypothetical protein